MMDRVSTSAVRTPSQLAFPDLDTQGGTPSVPSDGTDFTFRPSRRLPIHGWYPYVEGFSAPYVTALLRRFGTPECVYDPFGGSGTVMLEAANMGVPSFFAEINPFMAFVAETKVDAARWCAKHPTETNRLVDAFLTGLKDELPIWAEKVDLGPYETAFPSRDFFEEQHIRDLLGARELAYRVADGTPVLDLLLVACAANAVHASNMTRRADLRRRRVGEYKNRVVDVARMVAETVRTMVDDLGSLPSSFAPTEHVAGDCRLLDEKYFGRADLAITSPPYLNGTNYFRNTKIELWLLGMIETENDLAKFRSEAIAAGINNVTRSRAVPRQFEEVEVVACQLDECAGDKRIPSLVRHYFSDMAEVLERVLLALRPGGRFVLDIGDSQYYGVHVPTDRLLEVVGEQVGFKVVDSQMLAKRYSRDKTPLVQREIVYQRPMPRRSRATQR